MKGAFYSLDEFGDIVQAKARLEVAKIAGRYRERLPIGLEPSGRGAFAFWREAMNMARRPCGHSLPRSHEGRYRDIRHGVRPNL